MLDSERKGGLFKWPSQVIMLVSGTSRQALLQMGRSRTCLGVPGPLLAILSSMVWALLQCGGVLSPSECSFISGGTIVVELILLLAVYWGALLFVVLRGSCHTGAALKHTLQSTELSLHRPFKLSTMVCNALCGLTSSSSLAHTML